MNVLETVTENLNVSSPENQMMQISDHSMTQVCLQLIDFIKVIAFFLKRKLVFFIFLSDKKLCTICIVHPIFRFWFLVTFDDKVMKIHKYFVMFFYI